jgi:hypothetical protein
MEVSGQLDAPPSLPPVIQPPDIHCIEGWVGPKADMDVMPLPGM